MKVELEEKPKVKVARFRAKRRFGKADYITVMIERTKSGNPLMHIKPARSPLTVTVPLGDIALIILERECKRIAEEKSRKRRKK